MEEMELTAKEWEEIKKLLTEKKKPPVRTVKLKVEELEAEPSDEEIEEAIKALEKAEEKPREKCPACGKEVEHGAAECPHCGVELEWVG